MGEKIFNIAMATLIFACAWNLVALLLHLGGTDIPVIDVMP